MKMNQGYWQSSGKYIIGCQRISSSEGFNIFCKLHIFVSWLLCDLLPGGIDYPMEQLTEGIGKRVAPLTIEGSTFCNISEESINF